MKPMKPTPENFALASQHIDCVNPSVQFLTTTSGAMQLIEKAGRTCYASEPKGDPDAFVSRIVKSKHESVLEHACLSVAVTTDRGVTHELVRHRPGAAYSQESTRFCCYNEIGRFTGISVLIPSTVKPQNRHIFVEGFMAAQHYYQLALDAGESAQNARALLPNGLRTTIVVTYNLREWRHFLAMRAARDAHPDIQLVAKACGAMLLARYWPAFEDRYDLIKSVPANLVTHTSLNTGGSKFACVPTGPAAPLVLPVKANDRKTNARKPFILGNTAVNTEQVLVDAASDKPWMPSFLRDFNPVNIT